MKFVQYLAILIAAGSLAYDYFAEGHASLARWILFLGLAWLIAEIRRWRPAASFGFPICIALAGLGLWLDLSLGWMLAASSAALIAWDLADFMRRVSSASSEDDVPALTRRHLARLMLITSAGLILSLVGTFTRLEFSFEWAAFLALLAALGVTQLVGWMKKSG
ncbi:MAG: hypothetical protein HFACDABA_01767 [Anaerolineales bacterium]|nr:hypothetical protein [Anaerolineales bacterium]